ncbi:hypothetical protein PR048_002508 [Dryococelus australis]|uniref:Uncharacterized protein n=1 Tax=Dryococelus australis TaxID=614101 RepID=A0ABQ9IKJ1_9NEOP|nr:hypothetical protein PR048_002508 [Dryococelus australis]
MRGGGTGITIHRRALGNEWEKRIHTGRRVGGLERIHTGRGRDGWVTWGFSHRSDKLWDFFSLSPKPRKSITSEGCHGNALTKRVLTLACHDASSYSYTECDKRGESKGSGSHGDVWKLPHHEVCFALAEQRTAYSYFGQLEAKSTNHSGSVSLTDCWGHGGSAISTLASHQGEPGSIPGRVTGFSQVATVPDDAVGGRVVSGYLPFPPLPHSGAAPYSPQSPSSALKTSLFRAAQILTVSNQDVVVARRLCTVYIGRGFTAILHVVPTEATMKGNVANAACLAFHTARKRANGGMALRSLSAVHQPSPGASRRTSQTARRDLASHCPNTCPTDSMVSCIDVSQDRRSSFENHYKRRMDTIYTLESNQNDSRTKRAYRYGRWTAQHSVQTCIRSNMYWTNLNEGSGPKIHFLRHNGVVRGVGQNSSRLPKKAALGAARAGDDGGGGGGGGQTAVEASPWRAALSAATSCLGRLCAPSPASSESPMLPQQTGPGPSPGSSSSCEDSCKPPAKNCYRLVLLGSSRVGKTSIVSRYRYFLPLQPLELPSRRHVIDSKTARKFSALHAEAMRELIHMSRWLMYFRAHRFQAVSRWHGQEPAAMLDSVISTIWNDAGSNCQTLGRQTDALDYSSIAACTGTTVYKNATSELEICCVGGTGARTRDPPTTGRPPYPLAMKSNIDAIYSGHGLNDTIDFFEWVSYSSVAIEDFVKVSLLPFKVKSASQLHLALMSPVCKDQSDPVSLPSQAQKCIPSASGVVTGEVKVVRSASQVHSRYKVHLTCISHHQSVRIKGWPEGVSNKSRVWRENASKESVKAINQQHTSGEGGGWRGLCHPVILQKVHLNCMNCPEVKQPDLAEKCVEDWCFSVSSPERSTVDGKRRELPAMVRAPPKTVTSGYAVSGNLVKRPEGERKATATRRRERSAVSPPYTPTYRAAEWWRAAHGQPLPSGCPVRCASIGLLARRRESAHYLVRMCRRPRWCSGQTTLLPDRQTGFDPRSRIFACGDRVERCRWSGGFVGEFPFPPRLHSDIAPYSSRFTVIGSQALDDFALAEEGGSMTPSCMFPRCYSVEGGDA